MNSNLARYPLETRELLTEQIAFEVSKLSDETKRLLSLCRADLNGGPIYLSPDGETCECFDIGARQFRFSDACATIRNALSDVADLSVETRWDEEMNESEYETVDGTREAIIAGIVGANLAPYVR